MAYNLSAISDNSTTLLGLTQAVNTELVGGYLGVLLLIGLTIVVLTSLIFVTRDPGASFAAAAFISFGFSLFLRALDLIPNLALFITLIGAGVTMAITWKRE